MEEKKQLIAPLQPLESSFEIRQAIEAILYAAGYPVRFDKLAEVLSLGVKDVKTMVKELAVKYNNENTPSGIQLLIYPTTCQLCTTRYRDELISCSACGYEYVVGYSEKKRYECCPSCNTPVKELCTLTVNRVNIALELGKTLYAPHADKFSSDYLTPVGKVIASKKNPGLWGIKLALDSDVVIKV